MSDRRMNIDPPPKILVKVVHGSHVDMSNDGSGEAVRHGGELIRLARPRAERLIQQGKVELA
jgi:hypothetical protein